jgi:competence protein ComEC
MALNEKARTRAKAWDADAARRRAGLLLPAGLADRAAWLRRLLSEWVLAEIAPGQLIPWMAVAFGFGILVYFTADREPAWWAASALALVAVAVAILARRRLVGFPLALGFAAIAAGFAAAALHRVRHPSGSAIPGLDRDAVRLRRNPRGARAQGPHHRARSHHRRPPPQ